MARAHTAGKEKHGNMRRVGFVCLSFLLSVQEILRRKKMNSYMRNLPQPVACISIKQNELKKKARGRMAGRFFSFSWQDNPGFKAFFHGECDTHIM
jgi:hypothetical protein